MPGRKPRKPRITPRDMAILREIARQRTRPAFQVEQARILVGITSGERVRILAEQNRCDTATVWRVCRRYEEHGLDSVLCLSGAARQCLQQR